ncbi:hypothetical protein L484_003915 [Morus notabilis]|uniref:Uncharacterized protein n=1 Tax=Morus notabilis TaxID=981085 RepID=W9RMX6_9ROSA|nr:hypothetical protein L484_003915 [Morus notabilis]
MRSRPGGFRAGGLPGGGCDDAAAVYPLILAFDDLIRQYKKSRERGRLIENELREREREPRKEGREEVSRLETRV